MAVYPNDGNYSLELASDGSGWLGTFAGLVQQAAADILSDGEPFGPVEVTWNPDGTAEFVVGTLIRSDALVIEIQEEFGSHVIDIDDVLKFRA